MPGLSSDPQKAKRQLDALAGGRLALARKLIPSPDAPAAQPLVDVHTYPDPDPEPEPDAAKPAEEPEPEPEPERRRGGGFLAGLRAGLDDL